ncbi:MAG TPA: DUF2269 family protein [Gaiellaceae bacterium]|jgi:uncharacterized membrane protein
MSEYRWALFFHLVGVALLAGGMAVAGVGLGAAWRRERPSEVALLLGTTRAGVLLVALGSVFVLVCGFWLIEVTGHGLDEGWLVGSLGLFVVGAVLGAIGGRRPKQARLLAERLAREGDQPSAELSERVRDRVALALNAASALALTAVLLLMIWQPR